MNSLWNCIEDIPKYPSLKHDTKTDVLIIGGGVAGLLTAYLLKEKGIESIIIEKGRICQGTTGYSTAKITFQHSLIYDKILKSSGIDTARGYLNAGRLAFSKYAELCQVIDCDYEIKDNYIYSLYDRRCLEKEMNALLTIGYDAVFKENLPLPFKTMGAVCFPHQAQFHPLKFFYELSKSLKIYENTFARAYKDGVVITDNGKIQAKNIIVTTHFPFVNNHGLYSLKLYQHRSYVVALENAQNVNGMYLDENDKGLSFRNYGNLLLIGGGSHRTGNEGGGWTELRSFSKKHYPEAKERYFWAAQDCMSLDSIPYIGKYSKKTHNLYTATGFNKWGFTSSMLGAILLSDELHGSKNEYSEIFSPSRNMLKPQLIVNSFESAKNLLTFSKKRCPHLGCALKWNKAEHSWDCPCHGSRFDEKGTLLNGPANGDLKTER